jgi:hypothetical protein
MALALSHRYRCSICGGRDCSWTARSIEYNHLWLLLPYSSPSINRLLRHLSLRSTNGVALSDETLFCQTTTTSQLATRLATVCWSGFHHGHDSTSRIVGGNFLHVLLCNFGKTYPEVIHCFFSEFMYHNSTASYLRSSSWNGSDTLMLLQRDTLGNLPIHVASSVGLPMNVYLDLLRRTLEAQKSLPMGADLRTTETLTFEGVALQATVSPYLLSTNDNEHSLLDIELLRFIDSNLHTVHSKGSSYPVVSMKSSKVTSHRTLRDAVDQMYTNYGNKIQRDRDIGVMTAAMHCFRSRPSVSNSFLNRIKCIIFAAYEELQWLVQRSRKCPSPKQSQSGTCDWFYRHRDNVLVLLDWFSDGGSEPKLAETRTSSDNPYVLHYASALSGPTVICNDVDNGSKEGCNIHKIATHLLQVSRPFLDLLLLEDDAVLACNIPHGATGQLPLHFAVQAGSVLFRNRHDRHSFIVDSSCETLFRNESIIDMWKDWIQKLIEIDPTTCSKKDFMNRIPLHYLLLRCFHHRCVCRNELDRACYCCCRNSFDSATAFVLVKSVDDCNGYGRFPTCIQEVEKRNEMVSLLIRSNPESIELPCKIRFRTISDLTSEYEGLGSMPLGTIKSYFDYSCRFEVYQLAAMAYPDVSLNTIYSILRMCPSRCFVGQGCYVSHANK